MPFNYTIPVPPTDDSCKTSFTQTFFHRNWVDGTDVVQAEQTTNEDGFNLRFQRIQADIAKLAADVATAFSCIAVLRSQIVEVLAEIKAQFNSGPPPKTQKDTKDTKDAKDGKDGKDVKDAKDGKDGKDVKDGKDGKDAKDGKDHKDDKDGKDGKEFKDGSGKEAEQIPAPLPMPPMSLASGLNAFLWNTEPVAAATAAGRAFIRPDERPVIGERALKGAEDVDR